MVLVDLVPRLRRFFENRPEVQFAYLFGSKAKGTDNRFSDTDLAIHVNPADPARNSDAFTYELRLKATLMEAFRPEEVDLIILNEASITLAHQVLRTGRLVFSRDDRARVDHFVRVCSMYPDIRRMLEVHYRRTLERIDAGTFGRDSRG